MPFSDYSILIENKPRIQQLNLPNSSGVRVSMLRLDQIHPQVSGNKLFKLVNFLDECRALKNKVRGGNNNISSAPDTLLTFGGPFSNHLVATAFACMRLGLKSIGIVRGGEHQVLSHTLSSCMDFGMDIHYMDRQEFSKVSSAASGDLLKARFGSFVLIPAGGYSAKGATGATAIFDFVPENSFTHICVPVGTGTTLAGLLLKRRTETMLAFPAIRNMKDIHERMRFLGVQPSPALHVVGDYHFGGFAKWNDLLIGFINDFYLNHEIPLDVVYTSKMMYGVLDLIQKRYFPGGSNVLCIHTGGLQGNLSVGKRILHH